MDFLSHGLWAGAVYKTINFEKRKKLKTWWAAILAAAPDIFSFAPIFVWFFWKILSGQMQWQHLPDPDSAEPAAGDTLFIYNLTNFLYSLSHSLIIFLAVAILIFIWKKRVVWEWGGWLMHILIDIPTHSYQFYPTPFLWPFSSFRYNGFSWGNIWFEIVNYSLIAIVYFLIWKRIRKSRRLENAD